MTKAALVVGTITIALAVTIALASSSRLVIVNSRSRDTVVIQTIEQRIESRLLTVATTLERATMGAAGVKSDLLDRLSLVFDSSPTHLDALLVADHSGRLLLSLSERDESPSKASDLPAFVAASSGKTGLLTVHQDEVRWELWFIRTAVDEMGTPLYVLAKLDVDFLSQTLETVGRDSSRRSIVLLDVPYVLASSDSSHKLEADQFGWVVEKDYVGSVSARSETGASLQGHFRDIGALEGLGWRIVVLEPRSTLVYDSLSVVFPLLGVLVVGGLVALLLTWGTSLRIIQPLRDLERAARAAASGSFVRPLAVHTDNEIGEVSQAFNAVALRLNALHDLSQLLASASQLDQVLDGILAAVGHLVGGGAVAVYLLEEDGVFVPVRTRGREMARAEPILAAESEWFETALVSGEPVEFGGDTSQLHEELPGYSGEGLTASAAPLFARGERLGVVVVARHASRPFSDAESEMLRTFSAQASVAVHTSRLFEYESESRRVAEALRAVAETLVRPERLEVAIESVESIVKGLFSAAEVRIILSHPSSVGLLPSTRDGDAELLALGLERLSGERMSKGAVARLGESVHIDSLLERASADRVLMIPIALDTDHPAVLVVLMKGRSLGSRETEAGGAIVDEVALALDNAYFFRRALIRADNLENIFHISRAVGSSLQINVVLNRVLEVVQKLLSADALALLSYDPLRRKLTMSMGRGALPKGFTELELKPGEDIPGEVFNRGEPVALKGMRVEMGGVGGLSAAAGLHSLLAVPLVARGRSIGVLIVFAAHHGGFAEEDVNVLRTFAFQAALAIDTARLYGREHELADVLQKSILPEALPELTELDSGSVYAPAGENIDIGGDYYDVFQGPSGAIWIAIGDVCGKGIHAATKTSMIKYVVRALASAGHDPGEIISHANDMISNTGSASDIVTLWLGKYDAGTSVLCWTDGGHPPALLRRADGSIEELGPTGALLGAQAGTDYEEAETAFNPGDTLLLYTDGVTEARSGNIFFGTDRARRVLQMPAPPDEIARTLLAAVHDYVQGELRDDVAILVVAPKSPAGQPPAG